MGALMGLAVGDALGVPVEFVDRKSLTHFPVSKIRGFGSHNQPPGTWSDDTSLTFCLVESIFEKGFDPEDLCSRFIHWYDSGYMTPLGKSFGIGKTTRHSIIRLKQGAFPESSGGRTESDNGNGSLMRILPVALFFCGLPKSMLFNAVSIISSITHAHPISILCCFYYSLTAVNILEGLPLKDAYKAANRDFNSQIRLLKNRGLEDHIYLFKRLLDGQLTETAEDDILSDGYVLNTLEASLWTLSKNRSYSSTVLNAVNLGADADTTGAVAGGLAGLLYGIKNIPEAWLEDLLGGNILAEKGRRFTDLIIKKKPLDNAFWVLPGKFLAGEYPGSPDITEAQVKIESLLNAGIDSFIDLTEEGEKNNGGILKPYKQILEKLSEKRGKDYFYKRIPIIDGGIPDPQTSKNLCDTLNQLFMQGRTPYLHCWGGHGRTGTALGIWLIKKGLADTDTVLHILRELHGKMQKGTYPCPETEEQKRLLLHTSVY